MLNSLQHGGRSRPFHANLLKAGQDVELFDWIYERVRWGTLLPSPQVAEGLARRVWCDCVWFLKTDQRPLTVATLPSLSLVLGLDSVAPWRVCVRTTICREIDGEANVVPILGRED